MSQYQECREVNEKTGRVLFNDWVDSAEARPDALNLL